MTKRIKTTKVDGITVVQLYVNGKFYTETDLHKGYTKSQAAMDLMNMEVK